MCIAILNRFVKSELGLDKAYLDSAKILDKYQLTSIGLQNFSNHNKFHKGFKVSAQLVLEMIKPIE